LFATSDDVFLYAVGKMVKQAPFFLNLSQLPHCICCTHAWD